MPHVGYTVTLVAEETYEASGFLSHTIELACGDFEAHEFLFYLYAGTHRVASFFTSGGVDTTVPTFGQNATAQDAGGGSYKFPAAKTGVVLKIQGAPFGSYVQQAVIVLKVRGADTVWKSPGGLYDVTDTGTDYDIVGLETVHAAVEAFPLPVLLVGGFSMAWGGYVGLGGAGGYNPLTELAFTDISNLTKLGATHVLEDEHPDSFGTPTYWGARVQAGYHVGLAPDTPFRPAFSASYSGDETLTDAWFNGTTPALKRIGAFLFGYTVGGPWDPPPPMEGIQPWNLHGRFQGYQYVRRRDTGIRFEHTPQVVPPFETTVNATTDDEDQEPRLAIDARKTLHLVYRNGTTVYLRESTDDGATWWPAVSLFASGSHPTIACSLLPGGMMIALCYSGGTIKARKRYPGDTAWQSEYLLGDESEVALAVDDDTFHLSPAADGARSWVLVAVQDGEVIHFASHDDCETFSVVT